MTSLNVSDLDGLMSVTSFFELGELESVIDVLALYRCKACGFASPLLDSLSEHLTQGCSVEEPVVPAVEETDNLAQGQSACPVTLTEGQVLSSDLEGTRVSPAAEWEAEDAEENLDEDKESEFEDFRCGFCPDVFVEYEDLTAHQNVHIQAYHEHRHAVSSGNSRPRRQRKERTKQLLSCPLCPLEFVSGVEELQLHFTCHLLGRKGFLCAYCDRPAKKWTKMLDHLNSSHLLSKTEQRRMKPEIDVRSEVDFKSQGAALPQALGQSSEPSSVMGSVSDVSGSDLKTTFPIIPKEVSKKVTLNLDGGQKKRISRKIYSLEKIKRGPGRPRKYHEKIEEVVVQVPAVEVAEKIKRGPGRPRKYHEKIEEVVVQVPAVEVVEEIKRGPGRPRKYHETIEEVVVEVPAVEVAEAEGEATGQDDSVPTFGESEEEPMDVNSADGTARSGHSLSQEVKCEEIVMNVAPKNVEPTPETPRPDSVSVVSSDAREASENVLHIEIVKADLVQSDSNESSESAKLKTKEVQDSVGRDAAAEVKQKVKKKVKKPIIQTYFLYPKAGGGYTSEAVVSTPKDGDGKTRDGAFIQSESNMSEKSLGEREERRNEKEEGSVDLNNGLHVVKNRTGDDDPSLPSDMSDVKSKGISSFCPHCVLTKGSLAEIQLHISSHMEGKESFQCTICQEMFSDLQTWENMREHYEAYHKEKVVWFQPAKGTAAGKDSQRRKKPFKCERCVTIHLRSPEEVNIHEQCHVEGKDKLFRCPTCHKETTAWHAMVLHLMNHNDGKSFEWQNLPVYKCHICGKVKKTKTQLNVHIRRSHFQEPRQCSNCDKTFTNWSSWRRHEDTAHGTQGGFKCDQCPFVANHSIALRNHMRFHKGKVFQCTECNYSTWNAYTFRSHKRIVHHFSGERVPCDICGKALKTKGSLIVHKKRKHQKQTTVKCPHCEFLTTNDTYLKAHIAKKHAPKPYQCQLCPYGTMTADVLQSHMRMHTENRPYPCPFPACYFRARDQKSLGSHIKNTHTDDGSVRRFQCSLCGRRFKTVTMLKNHMPMHTGEKPHKCSLCDFRGKHRSTVHRHIKTRHCNMLKKQGREEVELKMHGQPESVENIYIEVPCEEVMVSDTNHIPVETGNIMDQVTTQEVASIVAFENATGGETQAGSQHYREIDIQVQNSLVPTVVQADEGEAIMVVPVDQIEEVIVDSEQVESADVQLLKQLMELATANPEPLESS